MFFEKPFPPNTSLKPHIIFSLSTKHSFVRLSFEGCARPREGRIRYAGLEEELDMNGKGILIVSENQDLLISVTECLRQMEFEVVATKEGFQRNGFFKASSIKGILLDLEMSGIDGMSMLRYLRKIHPQRSDHCVVHP